MVNKPKFKLITLPNPALRKSSTKVGLMSPYIKEVIEAMETTVINWEDSRQHEIGVALAAIQIDQPIRVIIVRRDFDNKEDRTYGVFINPTITKYEGEITEDFEGCLSIVDIYGKVPRYNKIRIKARDINGKEFRTTAEGFLARIFQHEIDHTNGKLFIDHIKGQTEAFFILTDEGKLEPLDYDKDIKDSRILWE